MKQVFAIFNKDARRFWPEIVVSFALLAALVVVYPSQWKTANGVHVDSVSMGRFFLGPPKSFLVGCLVFLIPVSWWVLIVRLVHGERLVGHTQFWLTRPYEWPKFLGAKILFVAAFVFVPLLVAQMLLLAQAGFNPVAYIPGLLYNLLLLTGMLILPLMAFSVVTSSFGRLVLILLGAFLFGIVVSMLFSLRPADTISGIPSPATGDISFLLILLGTAATIVVQYARRKLRTAWLWIAATVAAIIVVSLLDPDQSMMGRTYAADTNAAPVQFAYAVDGLRQPMTNETGDKRLLEIAVPLRASGISADNAVVPVAVKVILDGPSGAHWESLWQGINGERFLPGESDTTARFRIRRSAYEQMKSTPVNLRLIFAVNQAKLAKFSEISISRTEFPVEGLGICAPQAPWFNNPPQITGIACRSAVRRPELTYVTVRWTEGPCQNSSANDNSLLGTGWIGSLTTDPADLGIPSVWETPVGLSNMIFFQRGQVVHPRQLCPGSPITFASFTPVRRTQVSLTIQGFHLPELALGDQYRLKYGD